MCFLVFDIWQNDQPVGQGHPFNYTTTGPIVYPFIGGGRGVILFTLSTP